MAEPDTELSWLTARADPEDVTGYDAGGWEASTWVLHAMYENPGLPQDVTHDELHLSRLARGLVQPLIIGGLNLDDATTVTGIPLGFVPRPGSPWRRLRWSDYAARAGRVIGAGQPGPPGQHWFPSGSWPASIYPPPEGSLDEVSLDTLLHVLADHSADGADTACYAFYAPVATSDFNHPTLLTGPLRAVRDLVEGERPPWLRVQSTPSNFWPHDRSWFAWTDWDLWGTKISGSTGIIDAIQAAPELETVLWAR
ncbi:MAG TPA: hypothetical protein VG142_03015 [Trebonia sp.]|nr:hypothetical protein [Trebonia sp.]